jgi:subtilisin-like proprotein convertase family protein/methionine-rich copper-binding protein CopC
LTDLRAEEAPMAVPRWHALSVAIACAACGCAASPPDTLHPTVVSVDPPPDTAVLPASTAFTVGFSEPMDPAATPDALSVVDEASGRDLATEVSWTHGGTAAVIHLAEQPRIGQALRLVVTTAARDLAGNGLVEGRNVRYVPTADDVAPSVVRLSPSDGAEVGLHVTLDVRFDEPLVEGSAHGARLTLEDEAGAPLAGSYGWDAAAGRLALVVADDLVAGRTYRARLRALAVDAAGNARPVDVAWTFRAAYPTLTGAPIVEPAVVVRGEPVTVRLPVSEAGALANLPASSEPPLPGQLQLGPVVVKEGDFLVRVVPTDALEPGVYTLWPQIIDAAMGLATRYDAPSARAPPTYMAASMWEAAHVDSGIPVVAFRVVAPGHGPNLTASLSLSAAPPSPDAEATWRVENAGDQPAGPTVAGLFLDPGATPGAYWIPDLAIPVPALAPGEAATVTVPVVLPNRWAGTVFLVADVEGVVAEASEADNLAAAAYGATISIASTTQVSITEGVLATSAVTVAGAMTSLLKVTVQVDIVHTYTPDLTVAVFSPRGTRVALATWTFGGRNDYAGLTFDDDARCTLSQGGLQDDDTCRPLHPLGALAGEDPNGTWRLEVDDWGLGDDGTLRGWTLRVW